MATAALTLPRYPTTRHAVERFVLRIRRDLSVKTSEGFVQAQMALWAVLADAELDYGWPDWLRGRAPANCAGYLHTTDQHGRDVVFPLARQGRREVVTTVLVRGWDGDHAAS